jgi:putative ABC transport system permease protein
VRIGERRFRVIGVLARKKASPWDGHQRYGHHPGGLGRRLFNRASLFRILVQARSRDAIERAQRDVGIIKERHDGEEDITVITQDAMLATFDRIFRALTLTVGGIASISLIVAGILVMNVMLIAVSQRRGEIGLLKAIGAPGKSWRSSCGRPPCLSLVGGRRAVASAGGKWVSPALSRPFRSACRCGRPWPRWAWPFSPACSSAPCRPAGRRLDPVAALSRR